MDHLRASIQQHDRLAAGTFGDAAPEANPDEELPFGLVVDIYDERPDDDETIRHSSSVVAGYTGADGPLDDLDDPAGVIADGAVSALQRHAEEVITETAITAVDAAALHISREPAERFGRTPFRRRLNSALDEWAQGCDVDRDRVDIAFVDVDAHEIEAHLNKRDSKEDDEDSGLSPRSFGPAG